MNKIKQDLVDSSILIIDDNQINIDLAKATLEFDNYQNIVTTTSALDLNDLLSEFAFDLILLDINMPEMDGFSALTQIKKLLEPDQRPPIIMLTAQTDQESRIRALENGASDFITKPFNRIELLKRVAIHLENYLAKKILRLENQQLDNTVQIQQQELEQAKLEMIYRLGRAAEERDNETGNHVKRVSLISELVAAELGKSEEYCKLIKIASPMHDVGKIGVSDTILLKPGKLTDEEFRLMQDHVKIGAKILADSDSPLLQLAYDIALTHHEKFNGKGYPHGTKGHNIPLCGRIVAIADVFDALTSKRPYKEAWPIEKAVGLIEREKGEHFDPEVVEAFLKVLPSVLNVANKYHD